MVLSQKRAKTRVFSLLFILIMLFSVVSCTRPAQNFTKVSTDFTCGFDADYKDMKIKGALTRYTAGTLKLDIEEPNTLKGMVMEWDGEKVTVKMYGISFDVSPDTIPQSALGHIIGLALDSSLAAHGQEGVEVDGGVEITGDSSIGEFVLGIDSDTGFVRSLSVPSQQLDIRFFDVAVM